MLGVRVVVSILGDVFEQPVLILIAIGRTIQSSCHVIRMRIFLALVFNSKENAVFSGLRRPKVLKTQFFLRILLNSTTILKQK